MLLDKKNFSTLFLNDKQAILLYLTKEQKDFQFVHDKRARTLSTAYWPLHRYDYERVIVYKRASHKDGRSQVWVGDKDGVILDPNGKGWHYRLKNVKGPFDATETFIALFNTHPSQTIGYLHPDKKLRSKRTAAYRKDIADSDDILKIPPEEATTAKRLRDIRLCQQKFRNSLLLRWEGACAVTGVTEPALLRASHIKPFAKSSDADRVSAHNGLLLVAGLDALFDKGFVSFDKSGKLFCSSWLTEHAAAAFGLKRNMRLTSALTDEAHAFLDFHRKNVYLD